jgi:hypothetical protein
MHEMTVYSTPNRLPVALGAAFTKLMRIIPDSVSGYSDLPVTVKRYLLADAASAFSAVVSGTTLSSFPPHPIPLPDGEGIGSGPAWQTADSGVSRRYPSQMPTGKFSIG